MYLFLSLDWICYNIASVLCFWCFCLWGIWDLNSPTRNHIGTPCVGRQSLNHWATGEVPSVFLLFLYLNYSCLPYLVHLSPSPTTFLSLAILRPPEKIDCYSLRASQLSEVFTVSLPNISWELLLPTLIRALSALLPLAGMCFWFPLPLWSSAHTERLPSPGMASPQPCCLRQNYSKGQSYCCFFPPSTTSNLCQLYYQIIPHLLRIPPISPVMTLSKLPPALNDHRRSLTGLPISMSDSQEPFSS